MKSHVEIKGRLPGKGQLLRRPIPAAMSELTQLLSTQGVTGSEVAQVVAELEADYASVKRSFGAAPQHEADAANTMHNIRRLLSDARLERLGIHSVLAYPPEQARPSPQGHHR